MSVPRYVPERSFPPYAYVPGAAPHPLTDPRGHSYGAGRDHADSPLCADSWQQCEAYLWGCDLYNHGFAWEAHEAWEGVWRLAAPGSVEHALLKGLIQLAAATVQARLGHAAGAARLCQRAAGHAGAAAGQVAATRDMALDAAHEPIRAAGPLTSRQPVVYMGLDLGRLIAELEACAAEPGRLESWPSIDLVGL